MLQGDSSIIELGTIQQIEIERERAEKERAETEQREVIALLRQLVIEKREHIKLFEHELGVKVSKNDLKLYSYLIYEMMLFLNNKPDASGRLMTKQEALRAANDIFSLSALNQSHLAKEYLDLSLATARAIDPPVRDVSEIISNPFDAGGDTRERLKQIIILDATRLVTENLNEGEVLTDHERTKRIKRQAERLWSGIGKKTIQKTDGRVFASLIALNGFLTLTAFSIFAKEDRNTYIYNHPAILYVIGAMVYGDLFTQFLTKTFWKNGVNRAYVSLISVAAAIIAKTLADQDKDFGDKAWKAVSVYVGITVLAGLEVHSLLYRDWKIGNFKIPGLFTKTDWYLDKVGYQRKPTAPGRIFMAAALPALIKGISAISDYAFDYPLLKDESRFITTWAITATVSQVAQLLYFCTWLPFYARRTEREQGLQKFDPLFFLKYGFENNKFVNSRQAENIWGIWGVIYMSNFLGNVQAIYPEHKWISIMNAALVLYLGPRLGAFFQHNVFCRSEIQPSVSYDYLKKIDGMHRQSFNPVRFPDRLEPSTLERNQRLINKEPRFWLLSKLLGGPQTLHDKIREQEYTSQIGDNRLLPFGVRNQAASITNVALYLLILFYFWNELSKPLLDQNSSVGKGTWTTAGTHLAISTAVIFLIRGGQWLIASCPPVKGYRLEVALIEATAPITRTCLFIKNMAVNLYKGNVNKESVIKAASENVFVKPRTPHQQAISTMIDGLPKPPLPPRQGELAATTLIPCYEDTIATSVRMPSTSGRTASVLFAAPSARVFDVAPEVYNPEPMLPQSPVYR